MTIPSTVVADAAGLFRAMQPAMGSSMGPLHGAKLDALEALCLFYACKAAPHLSVTKTKEQLCAVFGVPMTVLWKVNNAFSDAAKGTPWYRLVTDLEELPSMLPTLINRLGSSWSSAQRLEVRRAVAQLYQRHQQAMGHHEMGGVLAAMLWWVCSRMPALKSMTRMQLAAAVGVTHTTISNCIRVLETRVQLRQTRKAALKMTTQRKAAGSAACCSGT